MIAKCPKCGESSYYLEDVIDEDFVNDEIEIKKCIVVCDCCDSRFLINSFFKWDGDEFIKEID